MKKFPGNLEQKLVDKEQSYRCIKFGGFKGSAKKFNAGSSRQRN